MTHRILTSLLVVAIGLAGCSGTDESAETTDAPTQVAEQATTTKAQATTTAAPPEPAEPWDLLYLSDSLGRGVAERLSVHAAEVLGVSVRAHDHAHNYLYVADALELLRDERSYPQLADVARNAEIIVLHLAPLEMEAVAPGIESCDSPVAIGAPEPYTIDDWEPYREALQQVYDEIWELREGQPTVLMTLDWPTGRLSQLRDRGIDDVCIENGVTLSAAIREVAEANGATMVSLYDLFNGPDHQDDPNDRGWMASDRVHFSDAGIQAIVDALAAAGFEPPTGP